MGSVRRGTQLLFFACALAATGSSGAVDITNLWVFEIDPPGSNFVNCLLDIQQTGTSFAGYSGCPRIGIQLNGTIDPTTGAFTADASIVQMTPPTYFNCTLDGVANASVTALTGTMDCGGQVASFAMGLCRNGNLDAGEACDTGFVTDSCCTPSCTIEPDATPCTNGSGCQTSEACSGGACVGVPRPSGTACDLDYNLCTEDGCDGSGACVAGPCSSCCREMGTLCFVDSICAHPTQASSSFSLATGTTTGTDRLKWKMPSLPDTAPEQFGDPTTTTDVAICPFYYDEIYGAKLLAAFRAPASGTCGSSRPCWKSTRTGFRYRDPKGHSDGLTSVVLKAGDGGAARIVVKGRGASLPDWPGLPYRPLGVILRAGASCWGAEWYSDVVEEPGAIEATGGQ
jgi:hypothetical protein